MRRLILPAILLIAAYAFAGSMLNIPSSLPEGTVVPDQVRAVLSADRIEQAIIYSDFRAGWYFFENLFGFLLLFAILALGVSRSIRDRAERLSEKVMGFRNAPLACGCGAAFLALLILFLTATGDHPVSFGSLGIALGWGLVGLYAGRSARFATSAFYIILLLLLLAILNFPLEYYRSFVVEHYFDLSVESFGDWFSDFLKGELVGYLLFVVLVPLAYWGIRRKPKNWWIYVAAASVPITILMIVVTPVYLDPMFNKYEPLKDEALRTRLLSMAEEAGISGGRVFQVDKSKDTKKVNAYVTGLFGTKRIVMWDTILAKMTSDELAFVMAHEMGHYVMNHVWKFIGLFSIVLSILLFVISRTTGSLIGRYGDRMGFHDFPDIASLPLLMLMLSLLMFLATPLLNFYSRSKEHDADVFGLEMTKDGAPAAMAFVKLVQENLSNPSPNPFIEFWLFNHPPLSDRINLCNEYTVEDEGGE